MNRSINNSFSINRIAHQLGNSRGKFFGILIIGALLAFELFNYSTTDFALNDLLGGLRFLGIRWATILAIAFCGIDFAGIARLFTPQQGVGEPKEVWYLFGAWLLAATMNAILTWWGVALAIVNHQSLGSAVIGSETLINIVPIFVAIMVWLIRILIIGTFSAAGDRFFSQTDNSLIQRHGPSQNTAEVVTRSSQPKPVSFHTSPKPQTVTDHHSTNRPEPSYHPAGMSGYDVSNNQARQ